MSSTLELNLSEENEIGFKLRIEGSDKDIGSSKPSIRFVLSEKNSGKGWIFSTDKTDEGVSVTIPSMKGLISEGSGYEGKLEVILGGRYFTPTEVDIEFVEPLKVEAAVFAVTNKNTILTETSSVKPKEEKQKPKELVIESEIDSIIRKDNAPTIPFKTINEEKELTDLTSIVKEEVKPTSYNELSATQKESVNKVFMEKCGKLGISPKEVKNLMKEGTSYSRKRLTALLAQSTKEFIDTI